jgi:hypothetical protein
MLKEIADAIFKAGEMEAKARDFREDSLEKIL